MAENSTGPGFAAERDRHERRVAPRIAILQRCLVHPAGTSGALPWRCVAYNISTHGVGITLPIRLQPGTELVVRAWNLEDACPLRMRVVRVQPIQYLWFAGGELLECLTEEQLRNWCRTQVLRVEQEEPTFQVL